MHQALFDELLYVYSITPDYNPKGCSRSGEAAVASGPITSWEIDGEAVETVSDFILGGSKITADGVFSH